MSKAKLGKVGHNLGKKHSEETKEKMRGRKMSEEAKEKLRQINLGKKLSEETRIKISNSLKKRNLKDIL